MLTSVFFCECKQKNSMFCRSITLSIFRDGLKAKSKELKKSKPSKPPKPSIKCGYCSRSFKSVTFLEKHIQWLHTDKSKTQEQASKSSISNKRERAPPVRLANQMFKELKKDQRKRDVQCAKQYQIIICHMIFISNSMILTFSWFHAKV